MKAISEKSGFTLLELVIVIVILGILASLGFVQYTEMIEKSRTAEAKALLGQIRSADATYYQQNGVFATALTDLAVSAPNAAPACADTKYYYGYSIDAVGICTATRCTSGGKYPDASASYTITLDPASGIWGGSNAKYY